MKELDKSDFQKELTLPAVKSPNSKIQQMCKLLKPLIYEKLKVNKIQPFSEDEKYILLKEGTTQQQINELIAQETPQIAETTIRLSHQNYTTSEMFNYYCPDIPSPNSFQSIGHIAHYNLTEEQAKHGKLIGDILLLKNRLVKTVVNKTEKLHNVYRTPVLELLAGQKNYEVEVKEQGTKFRLDFEKVYWCSRLSTERDRLLDIFQKHQTLLDLFCGVGPLAVRAASKGLHVVANDLNPDCYLYLVQNAKLNKVDHRMLCFNTCAREVVRKWFNQQYVNTIDQKFRRFEHVYMNLPVDAIEFLDVFRGFLTKANWKPQQLPMIHVNGFVVAPDEQQSRTKMAQRISKILPSFKPEHIIHMGYIKNVTIIMRMYCVSFRLSVEDASIQDTEEPNKKKLHE